MDSSIIFVLVYVYMVLRVLRSCHEQDASTAVAIVCVLLAPLVFAVGIALDLLMTLLWVGLAWKK